MGTQDHQRKVTKSCTWREYYIENHIVNNGQGDSIFPKIQWPYTADWWRTTNGKRTSSRHGDTYIEVIMEDGSLEE